MAVKIAVISIPIHPKNTSVASVLASMEGSYTSVQSWINGSPRSYYAGFGGDLENIDEKMGFWIYMSQQDTLMVEGSDPENKSIPLQVGWNLVGYLDETQPTATALSSIEGNYTSVQAWINDSPRSYYAGFGGDLENMSESYGYWIYMTQEDVLEWG